MPEQDGTTAAANIALPAGVPSIDPSTWIEPKETFPGVVILSAYRHCSPAYMEPNNFRTQRLPRPIVQWVLHVERLDQAWQSTADGSITPYVYYYGGFDLERLNTRTGEIEPINLRANKEARIANAWKSLFGTIDPPEPLVDKKATFEFYPSLRMQRGNVAKNILLPIAALPPDYGFTGEKRLITFTPKEDSGVPTDGQGSAAAVAQTVPFEEALTRLPELISGLNVNNLAGIVNALPPEFRSSQLIDGIISGTTVKTLQDSGKIAVGADGLIAVA